MKVWVDEMLNNKYVQVFILRFKTHYEYKFDFFVRLFRPIFQISVLIAVWLSIFAVSQKTQIAGLEINFFITYIILVNFLKQINSPWGVVDEVNEIVKSGDIVSIITKPIDYVKMQFSKMFAYISLTGIYSIALFLGLSFIGSMFFSQVYFPSFTNLLLFFVSLAFALLISYFFYFIVGCLVFWFNETWSFATTAITLQMFLAGELIPLTISSTLNNVSNFLPFKFILFTPTMMYLGKLSSVDIIFQLVLQFVWTIILFILASIIYKKGVTHFEAQGG